MGDHPLRSTKRKNVDNIQGLRAIPWVFAWTQIRLMLPAWLGTTEALRYGSIKKFKKTMMDMEKNWPYFISTMDILDMVISKVDPEISVIYENNLVGIDYKNQLYNNATNALLFLNLVNFYIHSWIAFIRVFNH